MQVVVVSDFSLVSVEYLLQELRSSLLVRETLELELVDSMRDHERKDVVSSHVGAELEDIERELV